MRKLAAILALIVSSLSVLQSSAAVVTWTGGGATRMWSEGANWGGGLAPAPGDQLVFPDAAQTYAQNDFVGASFESMTFTGASTYTIYGLPVILTGAWPLAGIDTTGIFFVSLDIELLSASPRISLTGNVPDFNLPALLFYGGLVLNGGEAEIASAVTGSISFIGDISERSPTSLSLSGRVVDLAGDNSFTGTLASRATILEAEGGTPFGATAAGTIMEGPSFLGFNPGPDAVTVIAEPLDLRGTQWSPYFGTILFGGGYLGKAFRLTGPVTLTGTQVVEALADVAFDGPISGNGHLRVDLGDETVTLGNAGNSFGGGVSVLRGALQLAHSDVIPDASAVEVGYGGALDVGAFTDTFTAFTCHGALAVTLGSGQVRVAAGTALGCALDLEIPPGFRPLSNQVVTVLRNDLGWTRDFTMFSNVLEGSTLVVNGVEMRATYQAGGGSDFAYVAQTLPAASVAVVSGTPQSVVVGTSSSVPFVARAIDAWGRPAAGARITFVIPSGCGRFGASTSAQVVANASGIATSPAFTAGAQSQVCSVIAQGDAGSQANFTAYLYAPADVVLSAVPAALSTVVNQPFNVGAELRGLNGMPLPGLAVTFTAVTRGNSGVASLPASALTDVINSRAVVTGVANSKSGKYDIVLRFGSVSRTVPVTQRGQ